MARRAKKRVRKRPRRSAGLRRLRGGRLTVAPSGSCVADEVRAACREYSRSFSRILQGRLKGWGWGPAGAAGGVGYNRCPVERTLFFSGHEAIAHGAVRAGAGFACGYPGPPSTDILETAPRLECINEKVALETAVGASLAGLRTMVTMKHVGLNVAADPFMTLSLTGINAGLVVVSADDPGMHSSQNEQDNRNYARFAKVPMLEPSDSQEAYDFLAEAFALSEDCLLYTSPSP